MNILEELAVLALCIGLSTIALFGAAHATAEAPAAAPATNYVSSLDEAMRATVLINARVGGRQVMGTGVIIADGIVLTAGHVVDGNRFVSVTFKNGDTESAEVLWSSFRGIGQFDLAILKVDTGLRPVAAVDCDDMVEVADKLTHIGHPLGQRWFVASEEVATTISWQDFGVTYTIAGSGGPGSSGGPLFDKDWEVVGVFHAGWKDVPGSLFLIQNQATICSALAR